MTPDANAGKKVALDEPAQVTGMDIFNTPFVYDAGGNAPGCYQIAQPLRGIVVKLVVVIHLRRSAQLAEAATPIAALYLATAVSKHSGAAS